VGGDGDRVVRAQKRSRGPRAVVYAQKLRPEGVGVFFRVLPVDVRRTGPGVGAKMSLHGLGPEAERPNVRFHGALPRHRDWL
jgi:hypothetical protein